MMVQGLFVGCLMAWARHGWNETVGMKRCRKVEAQDRFGVVKVK